MPAVLITATERSLTAANAPTADAIQRAFSAARIGVDGSHWVGVGPRVTRQAGVPHLTTTAAGLYVWPSTVLVPPVQALVDAVTRQLATVSSTWSPVTPYPYREAVNGPLTWWESGEASVTRTRDNFPFNAGHLDAAENPVGPTSTATHPTTTSDAGGALLREGNDLLTTLAVLGAVAGGAYLLTRK